MGVEGSEEIPALLCGNSGNTRVIDFEMARGALVIETKALVWSGRGDAFEIERSN